MRYNIPMTSNPYTFQLDSLLIPRIITLHNYMIWDTSYTVNINNNVVTANGTSYTLPNGIYSGNQLASQVATTTGLTCTYSTSTLKFTISSGTSFTIQPSTILGLTVQHTGTSVVSDVVPVLLSTTYYHIHIDNLNNEDSPYDTHFIVPNSVAAQGSLLTPHSDPRESILTTPKRVPTIDISVYNDSNEIVDFNGRNPVIVIDIKEVL